MEEMRTWLTEYLTAALRAAKTAGDLTLATQPPIILESPKREDHGDVATTLALLLAPIEGRPPREIAERILRHLPPAEVLDRVEIAGPGFLNFTFSPVYWHGALREVEREGANYGRSVVGAGQRVLIEFVSANPTGPLHVGHGRGAAVGDVLANLLSATGYTVEREYYINDVGTQIETLGRSVLARYRESCGEPAALPENAYQGDYIARLAGEVKHERGTALLTQPETQAVAELGISAQGRLLEGIREDLKMFRVRFDRWQSERALVSAGAVERALERESLRVQCFEADGAFWLRTTALGDDKDRVLRRRTGDYTYFATDIAYHADKAARGFDRLIDIWGADHHGYIPRMRAAIQALGYPPERFTVLLIQLVTLLRRGQPVAMSTRAGEFVTLREVVEEVGVDAARFIFLTRRHDSPLEFDLEAAKEQSEANPVYYVQYAYARLSSVRRQAAERGLAIPPASGPGAADLSRLTAPEEMALIRRLADFPWVVEQAGVNHEPHRLTYYLQDLASRVHQYYNRHRILVDDDPALTGARLVLARAIRTVMANALGLLGVTAPENM